MSDQNEMSGMTEAEMEWAREYASKQPPSRPMHYQFAYFMLPQILTGDSRQMLPAMSEPGTATELLQLLWKKYAEEFPVEDRLSGEGLGCKFIQSEKVLLFCFTFPPVERGAEAYFTLLTLQMQPRRFGIFKRPPLVRYFSLERGAELEPGKPRNVIGEWVYNGKDYYHINYGEGPAVDQDIFLEYMQDFLKRDPEPHAATNLGPLE